MSFEPIKWKKKKSGWLKRLWSLAFGNTVAQVVGHYKPALPLGAVSRDIINCLIAYSFWLLLWMALKTCPYAPVHNRRNITAVVAINFVRHEGKDTPCPSNSLSSYSRLITFGAQLQCVDIKFAHYVLSFQNEVKVGPCVQTRIVFSAKLKQKRIFRWPLFCLRFRCGSMQRIGARTTQIYCT